MKFFISTLFFACLFFQTFAQLPAYYVSIPVNDSGAVLKQKLSTLITNTHSTFLSYTPGVWNILEVADRDLIDTTKVVLIYGYNDSDASTDNDRTRLISMRQTGSNTIGVWNREHSFAKSLGTPDLGTSGPGSDAHHLRPADINMNSARGNRPFTYGSGNATIVGSGKFYPGDEWKGDIARMMMYMYLRYPTQCIPTNVGEPAITVSSFDQMVDIFLQWNEQDSVSDFERQRNNAIYEVQGNRNPFIDDQNYAPQIWGSAKFVGLNPIKKENIRIYPNPTNDIVYIQMNAEENWSYLLTDQAGKTILKGETKDYISLKEFPDGIYFLTIIASELTLHRKLLKN